jgi:hypothetical protein
MASRSRKQRRRDKCSSSDNNSVEDLIKQLSFKQHEHKEQIQQQ